MNLHCPCGLSKEDVKSLHQDRTVLLGDGGLCRNFRADGRRDANDELERCGMALGAHPVKQPAPPGNTTISLHPANIVFFWLGFVFFSFKYIFCHRHSNLLFGCQ